MTSDNVTPTIDPMAVSQRIMLSLPQELLDRLNDLAKEKGLSRSALIRMVLKEYARQEEAGDGDE